MHSISAAALLKIFDPVQPQEDFLDPASLHQLVEHLTPAVAPGLLAAVLAAILTPTSILVARRLGAMAHPDGDRTIHARPTPLLGGLALYLAFAITLLALVPLDRVATGLLVVGGLAAVIFLADDIRGLPPGLKLGLQALIALVAIAGFGFRIDYVNLPWIGIVDFGLAASVPLTLFWLLGMQNTINFLDGVDGLAAGVVGIVAFVLLIAAAGRGQPEVVVLAAAVAGVCLGFLFFNFHPARVFMGDSGAHFLALMIGLLAVIGVSKTAAAVALAVPVLALAIPIGDTAWAIIRRRRQGLSIAHPDSKHIHHQLLDFGLNQAQTCVFFYCATGILGALGLMIFGHRRVLAVAIVLLVVGLSTAIGEGLKATGWRVPAPGLRRLLS
jgi:UDP-GlcNAc:undecaprenyl-phosphate GlcNAc-1-phosphate transferase